MMAKAQTKIKKPKFCFARILAYARRPTCKFNRDTRNAYAILNEAGREPGAAPHVPDPQPPRLIMRCDPVTLRDQIEHRLNQQINEGRKRPRSNTAVLFSGVFSWPERVEYHDPERLERWIKDVLSFIETTCHMQIDSAVLHMDEAYPHLHIFIIDCEANRLIPGMQAKSKQSQRRLKDACYKYEMSKWQDLYYEEVGKYHGLDRFGPQRSRLSRLEYRQAQQARFLAADRLREMRELQYALKQQNQELLDERARLESSIQLEQHRLGLLQGIPHVDVPVVEELTCKTKIDLDRLQGNLGTPIIYNGEKHYPLTNIIPAAIHLADGAAAYGVKKHKKHVQPRLNCIDELLAERNSLDFELRKTKALVKQLIEQQAVTDRFKNLPLAIQKEAAEQFEKNQRDEKINQTIQQLEMAISRIKDAAYCDQHVANKQVPKLLVSYAYLLPALERIATKDHDLRGILRYYTSSKQRDLCGRHLHENADKPCMEPTAEETSQSGMSIADDTPTP